MNRNIKVKKSLFSKLQSEFDKKPKFRVKETVSGSKSGKVVREKFKKKKKKNFKKFGRKVAKPFRKSFEDIKSQPPKFDRDVLVSDLTFGKKSKNQGGFNII